jgi:signal transduction histidine kinase
MGNERGNIKETENSATELKTINQILLAVNASQTVEQLCSLAGEQIWKLIPFDRASIALCDETEGRLRVFGLYGSGVLPLMIGAEGQLEGSVSEYALEQGKTIIISDLDTEGKTFIRHDDIVKEGFRSALCVPLYSGNKRLGSLNLTSRQEKAYTQHHVEILESLRLPLSIAVEKALLLDQKERRARELEGLYTISNSFSTITDLPEAYNELPRKIAELIGGEGAMVATYDAVKNLVQGEKTGYNISSKLIKDLVFRLKNESEAKYVFQLAEPFFGNDAKNDSRLNVEFTRKHNIDSILGAPMFIKNNLLGFIYVINRKGGFSQNDVRLLGIFARQAAETIANVKLVKELRDVNKMKDIFLATVSHELRTPLMAIKGWADILSTNPAIRNDEEANEGMSVIQNSTSSLTHLISDLLDMSRLQRQTLKLNLQLLNVNSAIKESVQAIRHQTQDKNLDVVLELKDTLPNINVDKQRLQQILWNLLTNAIKFTREGGKITVRSRLLEGKDVVLKTDDESNERWVAIEVADTGEGIPEEFLPFVWDKFRQAETEQKKSGLGIGLSLVKELTEAHRGQASVKSCDKGTTFTIYLPVSE